MLALALPLGAWLLPVAGGASAPVVRLPDAAEHCATSGRLTVCSHADLGPEDPLSTTTAAVQARADALQDALQDAVLAEPSDAPDASSPLPVMHTAPGCTGDGVSGNRVQVVYALPSGRTDRFSSLKGDLVTFVARVDDVLQGSSALTGGDAAVRWVTDSSCALSVQKVPVSSAAETSFDTMTTELAAAGLTAKDRKYLVLVDTPLHGYCGIAQQYLDDQPGSTNANNGRYPMYARVDAQCWGRADHSTEAHELVHTLGGVQRSAPNSTAYGHCTDESDLMCYADGSGSVMRSVCAAAGEEYLDCRHDDYFSSNPSASSYLGTHWNTARSGFLTVPEPPTVTVAAVDEVRGSPFRLSATPVVRSGQTWTLGWHLPDGCTVTTDSSGTVGKLPGDDDRPAHGLGHRDPAGRPGGDRGRGGDDRRCRRGTSPDAHPHADVRRGTDPDPHPDGIDDPDEPDRRGAAGPHDHQPDDRDLRLTGPDHRHRDGPPAHDGVGRAGPQPGQLRPPGPGVRPGTAGDQRPAARRRPGGAPGPVPLRRVAHAGPDVRRLPRRPARQGGG